MVFLSGRGNWASFKLNLEHMSGHIMTIRISQKTYSPGIPKEADIDFIFSAATCCD